MKIIILGAGQVGSTVAQSLSHEENDITVVDVDSATLRDMQERLDLRGVVGNGAHPHILRRAGAEDADMLIALTNSDEINMVACQVAYALFQTPTKIARIRAAEFLDYPQLFSKESLPIDVLISPEGLVTDYIQRLIENPGALQVVDFADGRVQLVAVRAYPDGPLVGHELKAMHEHLPEAKARVAAIFRRDKAIIPSGDTIIEVDDEVFFLAAKRDISRAMAELRAPDKPARRVIIAGGGHIGVSLAKAIESMGSVKLIERSRERAELISEELNQAIVLVGDCADEELLRDEGIDRTDVYVALTNDDEANILSSMLARRLGAGKVLSLINRPAYAEMVESGAIDIAISPQQITIGALLAHVRRGHVVKVHSLRRGAAEAIEVVAHGDRRSSRTVGRAVADIALPSGATIGAIVRGNDVLMAHGATVIESDDHLVVFVVDKHHITDVERLFQVDPTFV